MSTKLSETIENTNPYLSYFGAPVQEPPDGDEQLEIYPSSLNFQATLLENSDPISNYSQESSESVGKFAKQLFAGLIKLFSGQFEENRVDGDKPTHLDDDEYEVYPQEITLREQFLAYFKSKKPELENWGPISNYFQESSERVGKFAKQLFAGLIKLFSGRSEENQVDGGRPIHLDDHKHKVYPEKITPLEQFLAYFKSEKPDSFKNEDHKEIHNPASTKTQPASQKELPSQREFLKFLYSTTNFTIENIQKALAKIDIKEIESMPENNDPVFEMAITEMYLLLDKLSEEEVEKLEALNRKIPDPFGAFL